MRLKFLPIFLFLIFTALLCRVQAKTDAECTLVVFNSNDAISADLAKYYAGKRNIPADHVVGIECSNNEEITRDEYNQTIAEPLRKILSDRGWWRTRVNDTGETEVQENEIRFVALIRGIPLKIARTAAAYPGDVQEGPAAFTGKNEASVDSELAALGYFSKKISGILGNPYYHKFSSIGDANMPQLMLVCRLDGPTPDIVRGMIDDAIETEKTGLWGFAYIDSRNIKDGGLAVGDKWLNTLADDARKHGIPIIQDNGPDVFPADYPIRDAAFYYGWYTDNAYGPFLNPEFRFSKGAIACHIHSFSASTVRDPDKFWAGPLLARGATAVLGNVYEPYLALTPNLDIFHDRLENGFTFAESAYMSQPALSWMTTFLGDPLYKPFNLTGDDFETLPKPQAEFAAYRTGALLWYKEGRAAGEKKLETLASELRSGIIYESLGQLQAGEENDFVAALDSFEKAQKLYKNDDDIVRAAIHEVSILRAMGRLSDAHDFIIQTLKKIPSSSSAGLLRKLDAEITTPPKPAAPATK